MSSWIQPHHETPVLSSPSDPLSPQTQPHNHHQQPHKYSNLNHHSGTNVFSLLAQREISPKTKHIPRRQWGESLKKSDRESVGLNNDETRDARRGLISWAEAESLWNLSADYCPLVPPKSTIAAAFSPDGRTIASTHGDHTVKIIDSRSGKCLKVLSGHKRTPWVVRFHPIHPEIVASGSLDHEVRLWNANTSECMGSHRFHRPIASIAFHATGEFIAVATGHKLYMWRFNRRGETSLPTQLLKTRRSLRAVHFHPHGAPFLLTAEANDIDSSDSAMTRATSLPRQSESMDQEQCLQYLPSRDPTCWELPFLQGWILGQSQAGMPPMVPTDVGPTRLITSDLSTINSSVPDTAMTGNIDLGAPGRSGSGGHFQRSRPSRVSEYNQGFPSLHTQRDTSDSHPVTNRMHDELASSLAAAAAAAAELPCTVKLSIWSHDINNACAPLNDNRCRLTIPHAVLCSEMGAHFSPCGRFLAACVACILPHSETESGLQTHPQDVTGASASSPTRHNISAHQVMYELRIYSIEKATFGEVLVSRPVRAAHCLTSIQFSPTSDHILLSYGRRHGSLLKSIVVHEETAIPIYTILEVYRVSDMEIMRVIPSAEDEVNVACFHPLAGGGLVYGTKEGKLRILKYDSRMNSAGSRPSSEENVEVETCAIEC